MEKKVLAGALAAGVGALLALDATLWAPSDYPVLHKLFDGDWLVARNFLFSASTALAALFGYLALNIKNGDK